MNLQSYVKFVFTQNNMFNLKSCEFVTRNLTTLNEA